jgi:hypothetical protein
MLSVIKIRLYILKIILFIMQRFSVDYSQFIFIFIKIHDFKPVENFGMKRLLTGIESRHRFGGLF